MRLMIAIGVLGIAGTMVVVQKVNHAMNYEPVMASVTAIDIGNCTLKKVKRGVMSRTTTKTGEMPCKVAEELRLTSPDHAGMDAKGYFDVSYTYTSPVDGQQYSDTKRYAFDDYSRLAQSYPGTQFPILAHDSDPAKSDRDYSRMEAFESPPGQGS